jgi:EmrB/QacA subfamily drug resistance transporter
MVTPRPPSPEALGDPNGEEDRERCLVLPCTPLTAVNADRLLGTTPGTRSGETEAPPLRRPGLALLVISMAQLMVVLDGTIVNIALPSIQRALHFSPVNLEWVVNAYALAFGGLLLLGGRLGDLFGRRRLFVTGLLAFSAGSLAGGLATNSTWLILARAAQGVGGAIAAPTALSLIADTFPQGPARNRAVGVYAAMSAAGGAIGLVLGGVITDVASWRWVLFVNVPIGVLVAIVVPSVLPRSSRTPGRLDVPGAVTATGGMSLLVYGLARATTHGWSHSATIGTLAAAAALLAAFVAIESRGTHPILPLHLLADRNRAGTYGVMVCLSCSIFAVSFFLTQLFQNIFGYSPLRAGFAFLPFSFGVALTSEGTARLVGRFGPRPPVTVGPLFVAGALAWLSRVHTTSTYAGDVLGPLLLLSLGLGLTLVPLTLGATAGVQP